MSEINVNTNVPNPIRVKLVELMIQREYPECDHIRDKDYSKLGDDIISFIESNYIPKEEHEELRSDFVDLNHEVLRLNSEIQNLREENERLMEIRELGAALVQSLNKKYGKLESSIPELLRQQRELCAEQVTWETTQSDILNAPSPSIGPSAINIGSAYFGINTGATPIYVADKSPLESWILWLNRRIPNKSIWIRTALTEVYKEGEKAGQLRERIESAKLKGELIGTLKGLLLYNPPEDVKEIVLKRIEELENAND